MGYQYNCKARVFGCSCTRTRNVSIARHELKCPVVKKFQKYLDLETENEALKEEIARLSKVRGRPQIRFSYVRLDDFFEKFMKNELWITAWRRLYSGRRQNAVPALFRLFLAVSPRFFRLLPCRKLVEVCGFFGQLRTQKEIHVYTVGEFGAAVMIHLADGIDSYMDELGFKDSDIVKLKLAYFSGLADTDKKCASFARNSLMFEASRRLNDGPIKLNSVEVDISKVESEKKTLVVVI